MIELGRPLCLEEKANRQHLSHFPHTRLDEATINTNS